MGLEHDEAVFELRNRTSTHTEEEGTNVSSLPPVDSGKGAWLALAGAFTLEALVWGFPYSFGIFQKYYLTHEPFSHNPSAIAATSTTGTAIMFLSSPFVALLIQRQPNLRLASGFGGLAIVVASLIAASYCNTTTGILACQGIMYSIGGLFLYFPAFSVIDQWFVARKGLAFGVVWTGTSVAGAIFPWISQWLLDAYGFRTALRVWAVIFAICGLPCPLIMRPRIPATKGTARLPPINWSFLKLPAFWWFEIGIILQSLAYFCPSIWLPTFTVTIGLPNFTGPLALCLTNVAACVGYVAQGRLVDHYKPTTVIFAATAVSMVAIFVFWGLASSQPMLYVFAILWGLSGCSFAATWAGSVKDVRRRCDTLDTGVVMSLMCAGKGVGSVLAGPISEKLLQVQPWRSAGFAYGSEFGYIIIFTGFTAIAGGCACLGRIMKMI